ncbi:unnamed protein product [Phytomonas sp. Hart1]|nr:unnamed protein product [Phytomonas sp. Hart1]|eukprot:CCW70468.1 unnamed protein product [Phytomonas sp. isolate Hart1]
MYRRGKVFNLSVRWPLFGLGSSGKGAPIKGIPSGSVANDLFKRSQYYHPSPGNYAGKSSYGEAAAGAMASTTRPNLGIHLYANKENAWDTYTNDRFYGAKRLKEYWKRMMADRGVRYYFFTVIIVMLGATAKLWHMQQMQTLEGGLLGPKKKAYHSRLTIVLDVDETILSYGDKAFRLKAGLIPRPYLAELLDYLTTIDAEVVLWSACSDRYMRQVLGVIDPSGVRISHYIIRNNDWFTRDHYYEKNIMWLKRSLEDTLIIENRPLSVRNCNANAILLDDFIRGEYMDTGRDHPMNDHALHTIKNVIEDLERTGMSVPEYLQNEEVRNKEINEIPCHLCIRQLPDEIARGVFYFIGDKYTM